jgi:L-cystine transport system permease protein
MEFNAVYFWESLQSGLTYLPRTMELTGIPILCGFVFGILFAVVRVYKVSFFSPLIAVFVVIYQGLPTVVALLIFNLMFMANFNAVSSSLSLGITAAQIDNIWIGIVVLSLQAICNIEEAFRGAFYSVDNGQHAAALSVGLTEVQTLRRIILPQMLPVALPMVTNNIVGIIKNSSIVVAIGITEVLAGASIPASKTYSFLESYIAAALIYWVLTACVEYTFRRIELRGRKYRRQLA